MTDEPGARVGLEWLPAAAAVPALVAAALPWFAPTGYGQGGGLKIAAAYCWQAGRIGFLAPLIVVIAAVAVVGPRHGLFAGSEPRTYRHDAVVLAGAGVAAGVVLALTWWLLPKSYTFPYNLTWDTLTAAGYHIARNPQPGYFLALAAAVIAVGCGVMYLLVARRQGNAASSAAPSAVSSAESSDGSEPAAGKIDDHDGADPQRHGDPGRDQG